MRLSITHTTTYSYDRPVSYALLQLRLTPRNGAGQKVISWQSSVSGASPQVQYEDHFRNVTELVQMDPEGTTITILSQGEVEVENLNGVIGAGTGLAPLWLFKRPTAATKPGNTIRKLASSVKEAFAADPLDGMHKLSDAVSKAVRYTTGSTNVTTSAEEAAKAGVGVCQDQAHVMIAAARHLGAPARYVSGYLLMDGLNQQEATHGWCEIWIMGLGWVGFDVANEICPDDRYVRVALGRDYGEAAPVHGLRQGDAEEELYVSVQVQQ
ncbi:transglutaminase family protein [Pseudooceanicola sp. HF7]|uniref:transglutaminase family protein n=1 Tax=Pseudooceanicola sp. HF7 TaxID=2721560 RepID=UPI001430E5BB|nr:transglutaminase family protein [Pseudooceanicola sp. HF7]NIZ07848.1 transglutaminase family protein [Pseudooceanicola sp. HF7]